VMERALKAIRRNAQICSTGILGQVSESTKPRSNSDIVTNTQSKRRTPKVDKQQEKERDKEGKHKNKDTQGHSGATDVTKSRQLSSGKSNVMKKRKDSQKRDKSDS